MLQVTHNHAACVMKEVQFMLGMLGRQMHPCGQLGLSLNTSLSRPEKYKGLKLQQTSFIVAWCGATLV